MTYEELSFFITIGGMYEIQCETEIVIGKIIHLGRQSLIVEKESGKKQIINIAQIHSVDEEIEMNKRTVETSNSCTYKEINSAFQAIKTPSVGKTREMDHNIFGQNGNEIEFSEFQRSFFNRLDIDICNRKYFEGKLLIKGASYVGNGHAAKEDIDKLRENEGGYQGHELCEIYWLMFRIAYDARSYSRTDYITEEYILTLLGEYFIHLADYSMAESKEDAAKCYYVEALKILPQKGNEKLINKALNMLSYTFFTESDELKAELASESIGDALALGKYYKNVKRGQNRVRDFLVAIFMLKEKKDKYYDLFISEIQKYKEFENYVKKECSEILSKDLEELADNFEDLLEDTYNQTRDVFEDFERSFRDSAKETEMSEQLNERIKRIEKLRLEKVLLNVDDDYVSAYVKVLRELVAAVKKTDIDEKIECYRNIVDRIKKDIEDLKEEPTSWGFCILRDVNSHIHDIVQDKVNDVCRSKRPRVGKITLADKSNCAYIKDKTAQVEIVLENGAGLLKADGLEIEATVQPEGDAQAQIERSANSIEGGDKVSCIIKFKLTDEALSKGKLSFKVACIYQFRLDLENMSSDRAEAQFNIDLNNERSFAEIENMYDKVLTGSGCAACPQMFKGRGKLINKLCNSMYLGNQEMNKNRGIILWGQRRVGKNSVKDSFKEELQKRYPGAYIHIDLGSAGICNESFVNFLTHMAKNTERAIKNLSRDAERRLKDDKNRMSDREKRSCLEYIDIYNRYKDENLGNAYQNIRESSAFTIDFNSYLRDVVEIITDISGQNRNILMFYIDEFTYFYQWIKEGKVNGRNFMQFIKSFISDYGICAVFLAQDSMPIWKDEYSNEFNCMDFDNMITYLDEDGAKELICEPCQIHGESRFRSDAVEYIIEITKGSAYLIDILCGAIIAYLNETRTERVSKMVVEIVLQRWINGEKDFFQLSTFESQYEDTSKVEEEAKKINASNKVLLTEIARLSKRKADVRIDEISFLHTGDVNYARSVFDALVDRKILEIGKDDTCKIAMPLFTFALLKEIGQMDKATLNYYRD